jgi:uncharacterized protein YdeI (BOF family)
MKPISIIAVSLLVGTAAFAQQPSSQSQAPQSQKDQRARLFSSDLVAWSFMQEPQQPESKPNQQPTPDPTPETQPQQNPTPSQPGGHEATPAAPESATQAPTAQTFTGTIGKEADNYVLKVSDTTSYKLDNNQQVQTYEGQRVQVTGTLDRASNLIHVEKVEPLS